MAMNSIEYREYLRSDHWIKFKHGYSRKYKNECYLCGDTQWLELHHVTYERLGKELQTDVVYLCRDCHELVHQKTQSGIEAKTWINPVTKPAPKRKEKDMVWGVEASNEFIEPPKPIKKSKRKKRK